MTRDIGFAVRNSIFTKLSELSFGITERLITQKLKLADSPHTTFIGAYAPTPDAAVETKESCYAALDSILADLWNGVIGHHEIGNVNDNRMLLLLLITNITFRMKVFSLASA